MLRSIAIRPVLCERLVVGWRAGGPNSVASRALVGHADGALGVAAAD
jgi:hypothetical protein